MDTPETSAWTITDHRLWLVGDVLRQPVAQWIAAVIPIRRADHKGGHDIICASDTLTYYEQCNGS